MREKRSSGESLIMPAFFVSGAAGGIYEIIWAKQLLLVFGASAPAVSTVLASYMAGLAIGSYFIGKYIDRTRTNPIRFFAGLEIGIAISAVAVILLVPVLSRLYYHIYPSVGGYHAKNLTRFGMCFLILVIPTIMMGGTLPVLSRGLFTTENRFGGHISRLYAVNTLGAMFGALIVAFLLLPGWGVASSTVMAFAFNMAAASIAYAAGKRYIARRNAVKADAATQSRRRTPTSLGAKVVPRGSILLLVAAVAGFSSMAYEIIFTRLMKLVFTNTTYAFATILVSFLAGIGIGSLVVSRYADRIRNGALVVGLIQLGLAAAAIWAMPTIFSSSIVLTRVSDSFQGLGWGGYTVGRFAVSFLVVAGVASLSGATLPLVIKLRRTAGNHTGMRVGQAYSVNTIAAVLGSFAGGFVVIPTLGTHWGLVAVVSLNVLAGLLCLLGPGVLRRPRELITGFAVVALVVASVRMNPRHVFVGKLKAPGEEITLVYLDEGASASVYLLQNTETGARRLYTDGILAIDTKYESLQTVRLLGHLPAILCRNPKDVLVIGFGIGKTAASIALHPVERIDCVEIVPEVLRASIYFEDLNDKILSDPRLNIVIDDGRSYLFGTRRKYDVISCDPIHPAFGSPALYTREYYSECKKKLNQGGVIVQYLPFHQLSTYDLSVLLRTFSSVFPHTSVWMASYHGVIVGSSKPLDMDLPSVEKRLSQTGVKADLAESNIEDTRDLLSRMVLGQEGVARFISGERDVNTDGRPILEYAEARYFGKNTWTQNVEKILEHMDDVPYEELFQGPLPESLGGYTLQDIYQARRIAVSGRLHFERKDEAQAIAEFVRQLEITPGDRETIYFAGGALEAYFLAESKGLARRGDWAAAIGTLEQAVRLGLASSGLYASLASLYISGGDTHAGVAAATKAIEIDPDQPVARKILEEAGPRR